MPDNRNRIYLQTSSFNVHNTAHGLILAGTTDRELRNLPADQSGFFVKGEIRQIDTIVIEDIHFILVARNGDKPVTFQLLKTQFSE